ncbi:MAG: type B 50S ribosomal protein L31 [SAR86 cluster bacterium]|uniref:Large ribosomal subunit protein bL31B n=1 Tax=SAR86 cluster bacterium TaxID=2030880 RepID=A0A368BP38_9GAMM|nr:MAG: type B 50S ribosomal protein L31 [SAR86 cluster bacterium]
MKTDIHPESREVLFHDVGVDKYFLIRSTVSTTQTKEWEDGNTYPYYILDVSSASHPFYTGKQKMLDSGGRVKKFQDRFGASGASKPAAKKAEAKVEETAVEEVVEAPVEEIVEEVVTEEAKVEEVAEEESSEEVSDANTEAETDAESNSETEEDK